MKDFAGRTAFVTGGANGVGIGIVRNLLNEGCKVAIADIRQDAIDRALATLDNREVMGVQLDVASREGFKDAADRVEAEFGPVSLLFNNAGINLFQTIEDSSYDDWDWVLGVDFNGVVNGVMTFAPRMKERALSGEVKGGHIVNTASMAGLLAPPNMGIYNVSKHAVVALSETLYQDLALVTDQVGASVLCPYFVPTGISRSERNRPQALADEPPTKSQLIGQAMIDKAVTGGKVTAAEVAQKVFDAVAAGQFYIYSHPHALGAVQTRLEDVVQARNPTDPFADKPELGAQLRAALRGQ